MSRPLALVLLLAAAVVYELRQIVRELAAAFEVAE